MGQEVLAKERVVVRPDGTKRVCEGIARRLSDGRIETILRDVTERREVERMNRRLDQALDDLSEGILVFDTDERLLYANRAWDVDELLWELLAPADVPPALVNTAVLVSAIG